MRIKLVVFTCFLSFLVNIVEGSGGKKTKCIICGMFAKYDTCLQLLYCPYCVKKHQGIWHYFFEFTKNKHKHVKESYEAQYTCLDFITGITPSILSQHHEEKFFLEFINAVWCNLNGKDYSFKNPDLQSLFLALFEEIQEDDKTLESKLDFNKLLRFYRELKWICLALCYECDPKGNYMQYIHSIFAEINETIRFLLYYIYKKPTKKLVLNLP